MTHKQWHATVRKSLAQVESNPARALKSLDALLSRVHRQERRHVGSWHLEQTVETISIVQSHLQNHRESAKSMMQLAERHKQQLAYYSRAFVAACATAALELASAGDRSGAKRALRQAGAISSGLLPRERLFQQAEKVVRTMPRRARRFDEY